MDPYDSGEEEDVWILGQSVEGQGTDINSELADDEDGAGGEEGSEGQNLGASPSETVHQNAPNYIIQPSNSDLLPPVPPLTPYQHHCPEHSRRVFLPTNFPDRSEFNSFEREDNSDPTTIPSPGSFFKLFFTKDTFSLLVRNTNLYAEGNGVGRGGQRPWKNIQISHLKIWIGIVIYIGVHSPRSGSMENFWRRDDHGPVHR